MHSLLICIHSIVAQKRICLSQKNVIFTLHAWALAPSTFIHTFWAQKDAFLSVNLFPSFILVT